MASESELERAATGPSDRWLICVWALVLAYFAAGVFGRFPWKADEPYSFGIVWEILENQQWLIPHVADQPFVEKPPLVYWLAAVFAMAIPALPPHEGGRMAVILFVAIGVGALFAAAKRLYREVPAWTKFVQAHDSVDLLGTARLGPNAYASLGLLLMVGTVGFAEHIHKLTADIGQVAGSILGLCGIIYIGPSGEPNLDAHAARRSGIAGGLMLGNGAGIAFMSKGLLVPCLLFATCGCLLVLPVYRNRAGRMAFAIATVVALPWLVVWPALFHTASPELFDEWLWGHNAGRFLGSTLLGGNGRSLADKLGSIFAVGFPALLLLLFVAWRTCRRVGRPDEGDPWTFARDAPGHMVVALFLLVSGAVLGASASMRDIYLLPMLPPIVLLGLPALTLSQRAPTRSLRRFAGVAFGAVAVAIVVVWLGLVTTSNLAGLPWLGRLLGQMLPLPFRLAMSWPAILVATAAILAWIYIVRHDASQSLTIAWCAGFAMVWVITAALLLPWIDAARSYRGVFSEIAPHMTSSQRCVATLNLGESELAMFEYVTGLEATRAHLGRSGSGKRTNPNPAALDCGWLLALSNGASGFLSPDPGQWTWVWTGSRPADKHEQFTLYRAVETVANRRTVRRAPSIE